MEQFYIKQAGNGMPLTSFEGVKFQRGHGFFGRLISKAIFPILRYLGKKAWNTGKDILHDIDMGVDATEAVKNRGLNTLKEMVSDGIDNYRQNGFDVFKQTGNGVKRRRKNTLLRRSKVKTKKNKRGITKKPKAKKKKVYKKKKRSTKRTLPDLNFL